MHLPYHILLHDMMYEIRQYVYDIPPIQRAKSNCTVAKTHAVSKKLLCWRMGLSVDKPLWKTHHIAVTGIKTTPKHFGSLWTWLIPRKERNIAFAVFKVASHHKSPVTGIVIVKFVVYKSWLFPRKSNKSMRSCGKSSLWTYFNTMGWPCDSEIDAKCSPLQLV